MTRVYAYAEYCATALQVSQMFPVRVWGSYRTYGSSGYGDGSVAELTEGPGIVARAHSTHRCSGYGYERHTELTEVPGTDMNALHNLQ